MCERFLTLPQFLHRYNTQRTNREVLRLYGDKAIFNYGCGEISLGWNGKTQKRSNTITANISKVHGSTNWLYCDNCRKIFTIHPNKEMELPK
jgi:hypothetical protein